MLKFVGNMKIEVSGSKSFAIKERTLMRQSVYKESKLYVVEKRRLKSEFYKQMRNYKSAMHNDKFKSLILVIITQHMNIGKVSEWTSSLENKVFGAIKLKPMQMAIINCNRENDVLVNLPTGFGKSLLFQYPASLLKGKCCIVFVPLKALLWDCLKEAELHNLTASELEPSFVRRYQKDEILPQMLFLTPERFFQNQGVYSFIDMLYYKRLIQLLVIDEAHCISQWGSDFRPDYARLSELRTIFPNIRMLAMSATIPPEARQDLIEKLKIAGCYYFQSSSNRTNLIYEVQQIEKKEIALKIVSYIKKKELTEETGIIYCQTIKNAEQVFKELQKQKLNCCLFHSKLSQKERAENFDGFMQGNIKVIVATICFGMGVNKKNIRYVINVGVSLSAENYYQQSGRAGRDGEISYCLLMTFRSDVNSLEFLIGKSTKKTYLLKRKLYKLKQIKKYAQSDECRKRHLFLILGQDFPVENCKKTCDYCESGGSNVNSNKYQTIDLTEKAKLLIEELQSINFNPTKLQLINLLKGKEVFKYNKLIKQKSKFLAQQFKSEKANIIEALVEGLMEKNLLVSFFKKCKGRFKKMAEYLKPCTLKELRKHRQILIKVKQVQKNKDKNTKITSNRSSLQKGKSAFNKYLAKKTKSLVDLSLDTLEPYKQNIAAPIPMPKNPFIPPINDEMDDFEEIKMVQMGVDYQKFFSQLFEEDKEASNLPISKQEEEEQTYREQQNENDMIEIQQEYDDNPDCGLDDNKYMQTTKEPEIKNKISQTNLINEEEDSQSDLKVFFDKIRQSKEEAKKKEQAEEERVRRKKLISKYDFV